MVMAQISINEYSNRVLNVIKAMYGLRDKSEALNKLAYIYGDEYVEKEPTDEYVAKFLDIVEKHEKKHGKRKMTAKDLDRLLGA